MFYRNFSPHLCHYIYISLFWKHYRYPKKIWISYNFFYKYIVHCFYVLQVETCYLICKLLGSEHYRPHKHYFKWGLTKIHTRNFFFSTYCCDFGRPANIFSLQRKTETYYRLHIFLHNVDKHESNLLFSPYIHVKKFTFYTEILINKFLWWFPFLFFFVWMMHIVQKS